MHTLETWLSLLSTFCWIVALLPQLWHNYCLRSVEGLSPYLLILWLLGDLCNFLGCILTHQLPFQTYLSLYFVLNDIALDFQYLYYHNLLFNNNNKDDTANDNNIDGIISNEAGSSIEMISDDGYTSLFNSYTPILSKSQIITSTTALLSISPTTASPISSLTSLTVKPLFNLEDFGILLAWTCTIVYCSSRLPQLYHNYIRESVDGISPLLFTFALLANLTYAASILVADIPIGLSYGQFIYKELPYLLGSLGTVLFDIVYFWQREMYKKV